MIVVCFENRINKITDDFQKSILLRNHSDFGISKPYLHSINNSPNQSTQSSSSYDIINNQFENQLHHVE